VKPTDAPPTPSNTLHILWSPHHNKPMRAQTGRSTTLLFLEPRHVPAALPPGMKPSTHRIGGWVGLEVGQERKGKVLALTGVRNQDGSARNGSLHGYAIPIATQPIEGGGGELAYIFKKQFHDIFLSIICCSTDSLPFTADVKNEWSCTLLPP
jgi:hypothetical protein